MLSASEIDKIKKRLGAVTPGPWVSFIESRDGFSGSDFIRTGGEDIYLSGATEADQEFIASARQDIPALLGEIERLKDLLASNDPSSQS